MAVSTFPVRWTAVSIQYSFVATLVSNTPTDPRNYYHVASGHGFHPVIAPCLIRKPRLFVRLTMFR